MPVACYVGLKLIPGGNIVLVPLINCAIHCAMYTYYGLAAYTGRAPHWKRAITAAQVAQFVVFGAHSVYGLTRATRCSYHAFFHSLQLFYAVVFLRLFYAFYRKAYGGAKTTTTTTGDDKKTS